MTPNMKRIRAHIDAHRVFREAKDAARRGEQMQSWIFLVIALASWRRYQQLSSELAR